MTIFDYTGGSNLPSKKCGYWLDDVNFASQSNFSSVFLRGWPSFHQAMARQKAGGHQMRSARFARYSLSIGLVHTSALKNPFQLLPTCTKGHKFDTINRIENVQVTKGKTSERSELLVEKSCKKLFLQHKSNQKQKLPFWARKFKQFMKTDT